MSYLMSSLFGSPSRSTPSTPPSSPAFEEGLPPNVTRRARTPSRSFLSPKSDSLQQQQQQRIEQLEKQIEGLLHENEKKDISILDLSRMVGEEREKNAILLREKQQSSSSSSSTTHQNHMNLNVFPFLHLQDQTKYNLHQLVSSNLLHVDNQA